MKNKLQSCINNELLILQTINGKATVSVGTLVRLKKNYLQINRGVKGIDRESEYVPYSSILKVSTGQKVLTR